MICPSSITSGLSPNTLSAIYATFLSMVSDVLPLVLHIWTCYAIRHTDNTLYQYQSSKHKWETHKTCRKTSKRFGSQEECADDGIGIMRSEEGERVRWTKRVKRNHKEKRRRRRRRRRGTRRRRTRGRKRRKRRRRKGRRRRRRRKRWYRQKP